MGWRLGRVAHKLLARLAASNTQQDFRWVVWPDLIARPMPEAPGDLRKTTLFF
jgi:hypothetical protein